AIARDGLRRHGGADMVFAHPAKLLGHDQPEQAELGQRLEVLAGEEQFLVGFDGVVAQRGAGDLDQLGLQLLLLVGEEPLRIPFEAETPEILLAPFLRLAHLRPRSLRYHRPAADISLVCRSPSSSGLTQRLHDREIERQGFTPNSEQQLDQYQANDSQAIAYASSRQVFLPSFPRKAALRSTRRSGDRRRGNRAAGGPVRRCAAAAR